MPPLFDAEPEAPTAAEQKAIDAEFPEYRSRMNTQMARINELEPRSLPSLAKQTGDISTKLKESAEWLKKQERNAKKNREWFDEQSHWANPAPPTTENANPAPYSAENAEVEDMIKDIGLYHVKDSDFEQIMAKRQTNATTSPLNKRPSAELQTQQPSPRNTHRSSRGPAPQRSLAEDWQDQPDDSFVPAMPSRRAGVGAQLGEPFKPSRPSGEASGNSPSSRSDQGAGELPLGPDESILSARPDISLPPRKQNQAQLRKEAEARAERQYWGDESPVAEQSTVPTRVEPRRSRRLSSPSAQRTTPGRVAKKRPLPILMKSKASQLEQTVNQAQSRDMPEVSGEPPNLGDDVPPAEDQPAEASGKGKKSKTDRGITPYERHVAIKDQLNNNHTQPINRLPSAVADAINAAIDDLFDDYEPRAGLVTDPDNNKTYVDSNVCVWQHIISKAKAQPARRVEAGCKTCAKNGRPCTLLQRQGSGKVIMVTYPRHDMQASRQPTDVKYWF
jgi:hypothetical protein